MRDHVKIVAVLNIVFGGVAALIGLGILLFFGGIAGLVSMSANNDPNAALAIPILGLIGMGLMILILICAVPGIVAGIGLLKLRPWARILTIVLSALNLVNVPIGTAVGIYGLWTLLNPETEQLFRSPPAGQRQQPWAG
jgi:hypothetical protein